MLADTHAHLYWDSFKPDFEAMIQRALDAGVSTIINVGVDVEKSEEALKQVESYEWPENLQVYSTIGIHPHESLRYAPDKLNPDVSIHKDIGRLRKVYQSGTEKVVAIGECGLDYLLENNPDWTPSLLPLDQVKQLQRQLFQAQIDLAKELNLPLIVHCRDDHGSTSSPPLKTSSSPAWDEVLKMVGNHPTILHCYSGLPSTTNLILNSSNLIVSFAATITYPRNDYLREAAKIIPIERIVLETDCPFLPPQSKRGQRNEPAFISETAQTIADVKGITVKEVTKQTSLNVKRIFAFPP